MKNKTEIIGWYGGDRAIARAAWTSTQIEVDSKTDEEVRDLLVNKLWNNKSGKPHKTPFERGLAEFNITCEQASHIHLIKHRLANINGESARYKELKEDRYYLPEDWRDIKSSFIYDCFGTTIDTHNETWYTVLEEYTNLGNELYHKCLEQIQGKLGRKRAKESARYFKTMNSQLVLSVMMNMSCFKNFVTLRKDEAAQKEIQYIATDMVEAVRNIKGSPFKFTLEAFGY